MPKKIPIELIKFLKPYDRAIQKLALDLRAIVIDELAPCHENIYDAYSAVAIGYGSSERFGDGICHIAVYTSNVNLGFNQGALLSDPEGALEGTGKRIRHISLKTKSDLSRPEIREFLRRALALAREDARKLRALRGSRQEETSCHFYCESCLQEKASTVLRYHSY